MTKARQRERKQKRQQAEMISLSKTAAEIRKVIDEREQRMFDLDHMRLVGKFGKKDEYSDWEFEAVWEELKLAGLSDDDKNWDLDAVEALFKKLNKADEAKARSAVAAKMNERNGIAGSKRDA